MYASRIWTILFLFSTLDLEYDFISTFKICLIPYEPQN